MMIYQIKADLANYKSFYPVEDDENLMLRLEGYLDIKGKPRPDWKGARVFLEEAHDEDLGKLEVADITRFNSCSLAYSEKAANLLKPILEASGELLPFEYEGQKWYVHNILNSPSAVDFDKSRYEVLDSGRTMYSWVAIDESKLNESSMFKLEAENYATDRCHDIANKDLDFKYQVEKLGLTGVVFEEEQN